MRIRRAVILAIGLPLYAAVLVVLGVMALAAIFIEEPSLGAYLDTVVEVLGEPASWAYGGVTAVVLATLQAVFLIPVFRRRPPRGERSKALLLSLVIGALIAAILTFGLGAAAISGITLLRGGDVDAMDEMWIVPLGMLAGGWVVWSLLLLVFAKEIWADRALGRLVGVLFAGTVIEILVVLPLDLMVRRRTDCYCGTGTFFTLVLSAAAALWLTGPGVVIALMSRRHRLWRETHCVACGYAKGPSPGSVCPECGASWEERRRRRTSPSKT